MGIFLDEKATNSTYQQDHVLKIIWIMMKTMQCHTFCKLKGWRFAWKIHKKKVTIDCIVEQECGSDFYFNTAQRWNRMTLICMNGGSRFKQNLYVYTLYINILFASKYLLHKIQVLVKSKRDCWMIVYVNNSMIFSQKNYSRAPLIQTPKGNEKQLLGVDLAGLLLNFRHPDFN